MANNTTRALEQAVSIDGWIGEFGEDGQATVHADVVFRQGMFGDDPAARVRFKIALKRAEIVLRIPDCEPLSVVKKSVRRTPPAPAGTKTHKTKRAKKLAGGGGFSFRNEVAASGHAEVCASRESETTTEIQEQVFRHLHQHFPTADGHLAWEVRVNSEMVNYLDGAAWHAEESLMKVRRSAERNADGGKPTIVIEVRCRREDIEILDLEEKDPERRGAFSRRPNKDKVLAAAEQLIKMELARAGFLDLPDLGEPTSRLFIADRVIHEDD